jgi:hypothetical protein
MTFDLTQPLIYVTAEGEPCCANAEAALIAGIENGLTYCYPHQQFSRW